MANVGGSSYYANAMLNWLRGTAGSPPSGLYAQLHTANPGAAGTSAIAAGNTSRQPITFAAPSGGAMFLTGTAPSWQNTTASNTETLAYLSLFDAPTGGNFLWSMPLSSTRQWSTNDTYTLSNDSLNITPIAS